MYNYCINYLTVNRANDILDDMSPLPDVQLGSIEPLYNIGVVARMTGISMATLRAWERRYNFPASERTSGGHRLYSEKDVLYLRWVKARIDEGMQTAQAIHALRHQEQAGRQVVSSEPGMVAEKMDMFNDDHLQRYQERLYDALVQRDLQRADLVLGDALALSPPEDLVIRVIAPTFTSLGDGWEAGQVSVVTEHLATNYLRQRLLMWMVSGPPTRTVAPVVLACAPNEWHEGSLLILGALLRRRRWPIAYLGQAVPLPDLASFIRDLKPSLVVLVAMTESTAAELVNWPQWMPEIAQNGKPVMGFGGRIYSIRPEWRLRMNGVYLGSTLNEGLETIERLLQSNT
jgi:DNA-binding transcriptional MerR regulator